MELINYVLLILVGIGAGFVQRVSGFGLGIFVMMFLPHFMPSHTAAASVSCLYSCGTSAYNAIKYRKDTDYKTVLPVLIAALICIPVAVYFSAKVSASFFEILLGVALIALSVYFLFFNNRIQIKPTTTNGVIAGALGGTLNGLFSTGGPPVVLYLTQTTKDNLTYFATIQFYFGITNIYAVAMRAINGVIDGQVLICAAVGMIGCMVGDFLGKLVFDKLDTKKLRTVIYIGMIISGVVLFL